MRTNMIWPWFPSLKISIIFPNFSFQYRNCCKIFKCRWKIQEMQNCDKQILDKLTNIRKNTEKMSIETNCRLTENTETNVPNMSGQNVRKMPVHQKCAKNAFRECPTNAWRPKMSKTCFQKCPRHALSTNKSKKLKYALFCRRVIPEQDLRGIRKAISGWMRMNMIWAWFPSLKTSIICPSFRKKLNTKKMVAFKYGKICPENKRPNRDLSDQHG